MRVFSVPYSGTKVDGMRLVMGIFAREDTIALKGRIPSMPLHMQMVSFYTVDSTRLRKEAMGKSCSTGKQQMCDYCYSCSEET